MTQQKLIYTWNNLDVFGEAPQASTGFSDKFTRCFGHNQKVPVPRKQLLKSVSGIAYPGELLAVLGSSGAGKTTLLNALSFRSPSGVQVSQSAVRALNGIPINAKQLRSRCAYVQQDDLYIGSLTTREHLIFQVNFFLTIILNEQKLIYHHFFRQCYEWDVIFPISRNFKGLKKLLWK